ncbi:hypothetical protein Tco_0672278 [Tanacetum coccineum]
MIPLGQKNTLAEYKILSDADNRPPMLDKDLYDSWKSRLELYMQNREHRRMILESVKNGPLIWPTVEENGVTRIKKYAELSTTEKIQADCDMKATNIILQGLPADIYSLMNHHRVAKDLCERVQLLMQGFDVPVFSPGDDLIACLNKAIAFLTVVASSRFPSTNNQLKTSSNPRNHSRWQGYSATRHSVAKKFRGDKGKVILLLGIRVMLLVLGKGGKDGGTNCQVDRKGLLNAYKTIKVKHMARQYALSPKRQGMHHGIRRKQC